MLKPSAYITAAVARLQSGPLSEATTRVDVDGVEADASYVSSSLRGEPQIAVDEPVERRRLLTAAGNLPALGKYDLARIGDDTHIVTSVSTDPTKSLCIFGITDRLSRHEAQFSGRRGNRTVRFPVPLLAVCDGPATDTDAATFAPVSVYAWTLCVAERDWMTPGEPHVGDEFKFFFGERSVKVLVSRCQRRPKHFVITGRQR